MTPNRHVVVVSLGFEETDRWGRAADSTLRGALMKEGYVWHVLDCGAPPAAGALRLGIDRLITVPRECAARLDRALREAPFLAQRAIEDPEITLAGCGRACQVIRQFAVDRLRAAESDARPDLGDVRSVRRLRQILLINPPQINLLWWALILTAVLYVVASVAEYFAQPERHAAPLALAVPWALLKVVTATLATVMGLVILVQSSEEVRRRLGLGPSHTDASLAGQFKEAVEEGVKTQSGTWPIPTQRLKLRGGVQAHPDTAAEIVRAVTRPPSHPNLYDIEVFERRLTIRPGTPDRVPSELHRLARTLGKERVFEDNEADYRASVTFSGQNERTSASRLRDWALRYGTTEGLIDVDPVHQDNLWEPLNLSHYQSHRGFYADFFRPAAGRTYTLALRVHGGYTGAEQCSHCHLRADSYYWRVREVLDLSAYLVAGWDVLPPSVRFRQRALPRVALENPKAERSVHEFECDCKASSNAAYDSVDVAVHEETPGVFSWEIHGVRDGGVLEFGYHLARGTRASPPSDGSAVGIA